MDVKGLAQGLAHRKHMEKLLLAYYHDQPLLSVFLSSLSSLPLCDVREKCKVQGVPWVRVFKVD